MISVNLTVHNKENILKSVLDGIAANATGEWELIVCLDGCTDKSSDIVWEFADSVKSFPIIILEEPNVFETRANNATAGRSSGEQIIFVQDDMIITERGWNERLVRPIEEFDDVFAVTARTAHNWIFNPASVDYIERKIRIDRWSDVLIHTDHADSSNSQRDEFRIRDCVNRGPLAVDRTMFEYLGGFDERFCPQDSDDHDICYRAKAQGLVVGYYGIEWYSKPEWGGTRNPDGSTKPFMYEANHKNALALYERHARFINKKGAIGLRELK